MLTKELNGIPKGQDMVEKTRCPDCNSVLYVAAIRKRFNGKRKYVSIPVYWCDECRGVKNIE